MAKAKLISDFERDVIRVGIARGHSAAKIGAVMEENGAQPRFREIGCGHQSVDGAAHQDRVNAAFNTTAIDNAVAAIGRFIGH